MKPKIKRVLKILIIFVVGLVVLLALYITFADLDYGIIQRFGYYPDSIVRYLSGEKVEYIEDFNVTGTVTNIKDRTYEVDTGVNNYIMFVDDDSYTAIDGEYTGQGDLPIGGYVSHGRQTVLNAIRIGSTITVWGDLQGGNEVKVRILHLMKQ